MRISRTTAPWVAATRLLACVALAVAWPAPAAADHISCPSGNACIWAGTAWHTDGYGLRYVRFESHIRNYGEWRYGEQDATSSSTYSAYKNASSVSNRGTMCTAYFYDTVEAGPTYLVFKWARGTGDKNLSDGPAGSNNVFASGYFRC